MYIRVKQFLSRLCKSAKLGMSATDYYVLSALGMRTISSCQSLNILNMRLGDLLGFDTSLAAGACFILREQLAKWVCNELVNMHIDDIYVSELIHAETRVDRINAIPSLPRTLHNLNIPLNTTLEGSVKQFMSFKARFPRGDENYWNGDCYNYWSTMSSQSLANLFALMSFPMLKCLFSQSFQMDSSLRGLTFWTKQQEIFSAHLNHLKLKELLLI